MASVNTYDDGDEDDDDDDDEDDDDDDDDGDGDDDDDDDDNNIGDAPAARGAAPPRRGAPGGPID